MFVSFLGLFTLKKSVLKVGLKTIARAWNFWEIFPKTETKKFKSEPIGLLCKTGLKSGIFRNRI